MTNVAILTLPLAKACEDLGNYEQAYAHYGEGNAIRKKAVEVRYKRRCGFV